MKEDNWEHRSSGMICATCMWFVEKKLSLADGEDSPIAERRIGRCRKSAPTFKGFVPVYTTDWCGEHRIDENKQ